MNRITVLIIILLSFANFCKAQDVTNEGKEFWVGYGHHQFMEPGQSNTQEMVLYLSAATQAATVTVSINSTSWTRTYNIPAGTAISTEFMPKSGTFDCRLYSVPPSFGGTGGEGLFQRGISIKSNVPIVAYAHTYGSASSGATMLIPIETWGNVYYTINSRQTYANNCFSWAYCVANEDNTTVEITPSVATRNGRPAGVPFTIVLNKGQIYQVIGANPSGGSTALEMTGTKFKSIANASGVCPPIAVFSGSSRTTNPIACGSGGGDNDNQQCFPTKTWGKEYLTAPTSRSTAANTFQTNSYKVVVKDPTTIVKRNGVTLTGLINNYYFFESNTADRIEADKPIMVAQFMTGGGCLGGGLGDPEMIYISPIEQGIKKVVFFRNNKENITVNFLTLITPTAGVGTLQIDGSNVFDHTYAHPNKPGYSIVVKRWTAAQAQATAFGDSAFTAITYGLGSVESYGYNAGTFLKNLNMLGAIRNTNDTTTTTQHDYTCKGSPVVLSTLYAYKPQSLMWDISSLGTSITPNTNYTDVAPVPADSTFVNGVKYYKYTLPGTYVFNDTGIFNIPIISTHPSIENCTFSERLSYTIRVRPTPVARFLIQNTGCTTDTVKFFGDAISANNYNVSQHLWVLPINDSIKNINAVKLFSPGTHIIKHRIVTNNGCVADSTFNLIVGNRPTATFTTNPLQLCENGAATFIDNSGVTGTAPGYVFYWDFGNGTIINANSNAQQTTNYPNYGTYTIKHYVATSATCKSDTLTQTITVYAKPRVNFSYPTLCVPPTGLALFNNLSTIPDGQSMAFQWIFGDPLANAGNPDTAITVNSSHFFNNGTYNVNLQAVSNQGCVKDTTIAVTIRKSPNFNYSPIPQICVNNSGTVNLNNIVVTNGVTGTGTHSGPGMAANGVFNPQTAGVGTHTLRYDFVSISGCIDSIFRTVIVNPKPVVHFTVSSEPCIDTSGIVQFNGFSNIAASSWNWTIPGSGPINIQNPVDTFAGNSTNVITLSVTATNGCVGDSTRTIIFNVKPRLAYPALNSVCVNDAATTINVATASVTNTAVGTGQYIGPGTSAAGVFTPSIAGVGTHTIWYKFTTPNGCVDSISRTIQVKAKPVVSYTYPLGGCLPANGLAQFNGSAALADAQTINTWSWNFNDPNATGANPNTSNIQNPTHTYSGNGIYNVMLTVTSSGGCTGDTTIPINFNVKPALAYPALNSVCVNDAATTINVATASVTNTAVGTGQYSGPGTSAAGVFTPSIAGVGTHTIWYKFTTPNGCVDSISQTIQVKAKPVVSYTYPLGGCLPANGLAQFNGSAALADAQTINTWSWNFNDPNATGANPNTSNIQNPTHTYSGNGIYNVMLTVTSSGGCTGDTTIPINFNVKPALAYPALNGVCVNNLGTVNIAFATVTNTAVGTGAYSGPGTSTAGVFNPAIAGVGTHTIWYKFTTPNGCVDSISRTIQVYAKPVVSYTYPLGGCLPLNGLAQFNGSAVLSDGQTVNTWSWNFNDPNATVGNPNTSNVQNPTHNFTANGIYNVLLSVTSSNGCGGDTTIPLNFNLKPALAYTPIAPVCQSVVGTVSVANATVTNGATGNGVYIGTQTTAAGQFNPSAAGAGTFTIWYKFTTPNGCVDSISQTINVQPKPTASFTKTDVCITKATTFTSTSNIGAGSIGNWYWDFGDGSTANYSNANPFTKTYTTPGTYIVKHVATSTAGCISDTATQTITVHEKPVPNFTLPTSVCMPGNAVNITNASTIPGNGILSYSWQFGDGNTSTAINPAHTYTAISNYTIKLYATSINGCVDSISKTFNAFFVKPIALFTTNRDTLCQGVSTVFTNASTDPLGSAITNYYWTFGDGTTATQQSPTKLYTTAQTYTASLTVTNAAGCVSDAYTKNVVVAVQPVVNAGADIIVPQGSAIQFSATANSTNGVMFAWSPASFLTNANTLTPSHIATADRIFTITATSTIGNCIASDNLTVKVLKPVSIPNAFSPNGDGINDKWVIENLVDYADCMVAIFNRYGQKIYEQKGYSNAWDGTVNGKPMPLATYYYVIDLKNGFTPLKGSITIIK